MSQAESHLHEVPFAALEEFEDAGPLVGILIGSESDREGIEPAVEELNERGISNELRVLSAHRDPRGVAEYASTAALRGVRVIIAGAGMTSRRTMSGACAEKASRPSAAEPASSTSNPSRRSASARGSAIGRSSSITRTLFLLIMSHLSSAETA